MKNNKPFFKGMCEMVMVGEDLPKTFKLNGTLQSYPCLEESDEEDLDALGESYDILFGILTIFRNTNYLHILLDHYFPVFYDYFQIWNFVTDNVRILLKD